MNRKVLNWIIFGGGAFIVIVVAALVLPKIIADEMFPIPPEIVKYIEECKVELNLTDVDTALVLSIMKQESGFKLAAQSGVGASGLMQIMPATFAGIKARSGIQGDIYDPKTNVCAGVYHIAGLLGRYEGQANQVELALAAYNGGPGAASGYPNNMPAETINYVRVVAGVNYPAYQKRLSESTGTSDFIEEKEQMTYFEEILNSVVGEYVTNKDLTDEKKIKSEETPLEKTIKFFSQPFYVET